MPRAQALGLILSLCLAVGCAGPIRGLYPPESGGDAKTVYVVGNGWHTGLVVRSADVPPGLWPERADLETKEFLDVGWGDEGFYRAEKVNTPITLKAMLWPTPSVMHVEGFDGAPSEHYRNVDVVRLTVSAEGYRRLCEFVHTSFARPTRDASTPILAPGLCRNSFFYRASESYYLPKSCNSWTARSLRQAGCPIRPLTCLTAGQALRRVCKFPTSVVLKRR